ncbi:MAG: outer membrane protein assembly factor BamD [Deltaproteobacteria bacterium]|nr:outer membrane protein assembly factor BamD [Deltaproteobacteria bacterium]
MIFVLGLIVAAGCASAPPDEEIPSAESYYRRGLELLEGQRVFLFFHDVNYPRAIEHFQEVIDNYPYSDYATLAELKLADVHFQQGHYEEAASYYQDFVELHPTHPQVPYSIFRHGMCSFEEIGDVGRDQTPTLDALAQFRVLLDRYPNSEHADDARVRLGQAIDQLARHDIEVGDFYYRRGDYYAASRRYRQALEMYPDHSERVTTLVRLGRSLMGLQLYAEAKRIYQQALDARPPGGLRNNDRKELREFGEDLWNARKEDS